ncbi:MAG TPA: glycosyltransferase family 4 protein [Ktedonosporobacter sp.]|jgi:glycosyltransferase involved in cell wall biosynthesis|nr:glycosyltransferase family 4 protein [Ktedonosporobacter sp.]
MRIALVAPLVTPIAQPYVGGAQALVADLAQGLTRRQHSVTLFARAGSSIPGVAIEQITVPSSVHPASFSAPSQERAADPGFFAQANLFLDLFLQLQQRQHEFDLVHVHAFDWPAFACSTLLHDLPVVHTIHLPAVSPEINQALRVLHDQNHPLTLVTVSHACALSYADFTPFDHVIYNGLELAAIPFSAEVPPDAPLLFAGRIAPEKGVDAAIEIAERAGRRLLIAGGIYDQDYYEQKIAPRIKRAGECVSYLGQLEHAALWQVMGQSLGLLFPIAWEEPFGLTAVEAMASGTPVIAFRRGAAQEVIRHGETGFLVTPGDCTDAAMRVNELAALSRTQCRAHVERNFSLARMLDEYEQVFASLIRPSKD